MLETLRQIFCSHDWTTTIGLGILPKKNTPELVAMPVQRMKCKRCRKIDFKMLGGK